MKNYNNSDEQPFLNKFKKDSHDIYKNIRNIRKNIDYILRTLDYLSKENKKDHKTD